MNAAQILNIAVLTITIHAEEAVAPPRPPADETQPTEVLRPRVIGENLLAAIAGHMARKKASFNDTGGLQIESDNGMVALWFFPDPARREETIDQFFVIQSQVNRPATMHSMEDNEAMRELIKAAIPPSLWEYFDEPVSKCLDSALHDAVYNSDARGRADRFKKGISLWRDVDLLKIQARLWMDKNKPSVRIECKWKDGDSPEAIAFKSKFIASLKLAKAKKPASDTDFDTLVHRTQFVAQPVKTQSPKK